MLNFYSFIIYFQYMIMLLLSVAFLTLFERKLLSYIQIRKGPNKVGLMGLIQPFSDAIKLFSKETLILLKSNYFYYLFSPLLMMFIMLMLWINIPLMSNLMNYSLSILMILCFMSLSVYGLMIAGWSSNSVYSMIGSLRSIAQTISYEVSMILIMMNVMMLVETFNLFKYKYFQIYMWFFILMFPLSFIYFVSLLAEMNRTPFDFSEGESELVSGFNTEYMSGSFALIFIAEYGMIKFMMYLFMMLFMGSNYYYLNFFIYYLLMLFLVIWVRGTFPRFRYDNLMYLTWKVYLPLSLIYLIFNLMIKFILLN